MPSCTEAKRALRVQLRAQAAALSLRERAESDRALCRRFLELPQTAEAGTLLLFWGVGTEPDTRPLLDALWAQGKRVLLPRCLPGHVLEARLVRSPRELVPGAYGIPEPGSDCPVVEGREIDLILVPAVAYDRQCLRLGQGGGYYDRCLAGYRAERWACAGMSCSRTACLPSPTTWGWRWSSPRPAAFPPDKRAPAEPRGPRRCLEDYREVK